MKQITPVVCFGRIKHATLGPQERLPYHSNISFSINALSSLATSKLFSWC